MRIGRAKTAIGRGSVGVATVHLSEADVCEST